MIELCRILVSQPRSWDTQFCTGIAAVLTPMERLSLPDARERVVWTGGDAPPDRVGVVDWTGKVGAVMSTEGLW